MVKFSKTKRKMLFITATACAVYFFARKLSFGIISVTIGEQTKCSSPICDLCPVITIPETAKTVKNARNENDDPLENEAPPERHLANMSDPLANFNFGPKKQNWSIPTLSSEELDQLNVTISPNARCPQRYGPVAFFLIYTNKAAYVDATNTVRCYARSRGYPLFRVHVFEDLLGIKYCSHVKDVFYRKHCVASLYLQKVKWLVVTDGDTAVINANHCMEEYIRDDAEIIFYERFFSGEITSGNYIVKNTVMARQFLIDWAKIEVESPFPPYFFSADNGALHVALLRAVFPTDYELHRRCVSHIRHSVWPNFGPGYGGYVRCTKRAFRKLQRASDDEAKPAGLLKVTIVPRAQAWVRDMDMTHNNYYAGDFMSHGVKHQRPLANETVLALKPYVNDTVPEICRASDWAPSLNGAAKRTTTEMRAELKRFGRNVEGGSLKPLFARKDYYVCWPYCPPVVQTF